jgi:tetratricopeptide (TPR) repeat protein
MSTSPRIVVDRVLAKGVSWIIGLGYSGYKEVLVPTVNMLEREAQSSVRCGSLCYLIGHLHSINGAPLEAIKFYKRANSLIKESAPYREIGDLYYLMGNLARSKYYHRKALALDREDEFSIGTLESIEEKRNSGARVSPVYEAGDVRWHVMELLSRGEWQMAVSSLRRRRSTDLRQCRAMAYGVGEDSNRASEQWQLVIGSGDRIAIGAADWFYLAKELWNSTDFWSNLLTASTRIDNLGLMYDGMGGISQTKSARIRRIRAICEFHVYRITNDNKSILKLCRLYPEWKVAKRVAESWDVQLDPQIKGCAWS